MRDALFFIVIALLLVHEMDAVRCHEWRILPPFSLMPELAAMTTFILAHVPLYAFLLWGPLTGQNGPSSNWVVGLNLFAIGHGIAHVALRHHPKSEFRGLLSYSLIVAAAAVAVINLVIRWW